MSLGLGELLRFRSVEKGVASLDPRVKLALSVYLFALPVIYDRPPVLSLVASGSVLAAVTLFLATFGEARRVVRTVRALGPFLAFVLLLNVLSSLASGSSPLTLEFALSNAALLLRFIAVFTSFSFFVLSTSPEDFAQVLRWMRVPYDYAFALTASIRFAPLFLEEVQEVIDSQRLRGVSYETRNPVKLFRNYVRAFLPVTVNAIMRAFEMAEALEVKCFGAVEKRTSYRTLRSRPRDHIVLAVATLVFAAAVAFRYLWPL
ncbi:MAG: energy-coupling factor transporter transmembrane protein EcfT [Aigarchaeota archaeon]|nr:energy-coupling factor transporter transmembrane protein EcfT [Candidatus Calditenuis fumarioli]